MLALTYESDTMVWRSKEGSEIRAVQMDDLISLLDIRRTDRVPNALVRELFLCVEVGG